MYSRRGFTVVELVVVMVIMAILLGLGSLSLMRNQANARDTERNADASVIARGLEMRYRLGNTRATSTTYDLNPGSYPGTIEMAHIMGQDMTTSGLTPGVVSGGYGPDALSGTSLQNFSPPDLGSTSYSGFQVYCPAATCIADATSTVAATVTKDVYLYEPIGADNKVCSGTNANPCVRFNLYWRDEIATDTSTGASNTLHVIRSEHQ